MRSSCALLEQDLRGKFRARCRDGRADGVSVRDQLGSLLALQLRYIVSKAELATPDLTKAIVTNLRRNLGIYGIVPLASMAMSLVSPRTGMYMYLLLAIPTFAPSRLDRLLHPGATARADSTSEES